MKEKSFERRAFLKRENGNVTIRQSSLLPAKKLTADRITQLEIRTYDMVLHLSDGSRIRIKLGLKYPDLGQKVRDFIIRYAEDNKIEIFYKNESL